jgi:hypothetical protein
MKIIKYLGFFVFGIFLLVGVRMSYANDAGPNSNFWATDNKVHCISFINPLFVGNDAFLVFDYSIEVGQSLGKPWSIIEKGKCYEIKDGNEEVYEIKIINGDEREIFSNYKNYNSADNIIEVFCKGDYRCQETTLGQSIKNMNLHTEYSVTTSREQEIHFMLEINNLFPTKYDFGYPITSHISTTPEELKPVMKHSSFISLDNIYNSLANKLNITLRSCDNRIRVEDQYMVTTNSIYNYNYLFKTNVIWRFANNKDLIVKKFNGELNQDGSPRTISFTELDSLGAIELMGCKESFISFTKDNKLNFDEIDRLTDDLINKFSGILEGNYYMEINPRKDSEIKKILDFVNLSSNNIDSPLNTTLKFDEDKTPTVLDEPTSEKKMEIIKGSTNPFMKAYVWFPAVALFGILMVLIFKKKRQE